MRLSRAVIPRLTVGSAAKVLAPLLLAAVISPLAVLLFPPPTALGDAHHYLMTAKRLAYDGYFAYGAAPSGSDVPPNAIVTPGWPLALSAVFALLGDSGDPVENVQRARIPIMLMMFVLSLSIVLAITLSGRALGGENLGLLAGMMAAVYPPFHWAGTVMLAEHLGAALLAWATYAALRLVAPDTKRTYLGVAVLGVLCGLLVMVRPNLLLWVFVPLVYTAVRRLEPPARLARLALVGAVGFCLVFAPWWIRNVVVMERFIPVKSNYIPDSHSSTGASARSDGGVPVAAGADDQQATSADARTSAATGAEMPGGWEYTSPRMVLRRAAVPWTPFFDVLWEETYRPDVQGIEFSYSRNPSVPLGNTVSNIATIYHRGLLILAAASLLFVRRSPRLLILAAVPVALLAIHWSHVTIRYLYPPMTAVVIMSAVSAYAYYHMVSRKPEAS